MVILATFALGLLLLGIPAAYGIWYWRSLPNQLADSIASCDVVEKLINEAVGMDIREARDYLRVARKWFAQAETALAEGRRADARKLMSDGIGVLGVARRLVLPDEKDSQDDDWRLRSFLKRR